MEYYGKSKEIQLNYSTTALDGLSNVQTNSQYKRIYVLVIDREGAI